MIFHDDLDDPLDDLLGAPMRPAPARPMPAGVEPDAFFIENCPKCHGTGRFGRFGSCFKCQGKGKMSFKSSAQSRATARHKRVEKKLNAVEAFGKEYPEIVAWWTGSTFPFAIAMQEAVTKYGSLTDNQLAACRKCIMALETKRAAAQVERTARVAAAPEITVEKIEDAFEAAKSSGLKWPKLHLGDFTFKPAGANSKNPGAIYVTEGEEYLGKIAGGKFVCVRTCGDERQERILAAAADPENAAVAHGKMTGSCSCCGRELTDPESVARGIGPICAERYGW